MLVIAAVAFGQVLFAVALASLVYRLIQQQGRMLIRIEALEARADPKRSARRRS